MASETTPDKYYHTERVRYADTDAQGHVFFGNYYTYMDEAFMAYLEELGYPASKLTAMGLEIYYVESGCQHKGRTFFSDRLHVYLEISRMGSSSLTAIMRIVKAAEDGGEEVALGTITGVFVDVESGKSTPIPADFREAVLRYQGTT